MTEEQKKFLHDQIAEILELPLNKVIWAYQNLMARQTPPYVLLRLFGMKAEGQEEIRDTENDDVKKIFVSQAVILEVQYFAGTKITIDPTRELEKLLRQLENPEVVEKFFLNKIAVFDHEEIQDLTTLIDSQTYEYRALVELRVRFNSIIESKLGAIEKVKIEGAVENSAVPLNFEIEGD